MHRSKIKKFRQTIWNHYKNHKRDFAWRRTKNPYHILISEIMLQQTQTERVERYYPKFIKQFPDFEKLARAPLHEILKTWQGLGYNRRALYLKKIAAIVTETYRGQLPRDTSTLEKLPGIGKATAGSIMVFAFNVPAIFIETNIRRVFIHFFFPRKRRISDVEILPLTEKTLGSQNVRNWYYALMDYGAMLGKTAKKNPNKKSLSYHKQTPFQGSDRQLRGAILKMRLAYKGTANKQLAKKLRQPFARITDITQKLKRDGLI